MRKINKLFLQIQKMWKTVSTQIENFSQHKFIKFNQMSKSNFDKNGLDQFGTHWLQYAALFVFAFAVYTTWAFYNDANFHNFIIKIFKFLNCKGYNPINYCIMRWKTAY